MTGSDAASGWVGWALAHPEFGSSVREHPFKTSANLSRFLTPTPYRLQFFTTIRRQIWQIFDPFPP